MCDETISSHMFCSYQALLMQKEPFLRDLRAGIEMERAGVLREFDALAEIEKSGKRCLVYFSVRGITIAGNIGLELLPNETLRITSAVRSCPSSY